MTVLKKLFAKPAALRKHVHHLLARRSHTEGRNARPLIFFVHVPKTAGSTVNSFLHEFLPDGRSHCEAFIHDNDVMVSAVDSCDWFSGHVDFSTAETILGQSTDRPVRYFACMRNPTDHVMSHYNWLIEIFYREKSFYDRCPAVVKEISETIRTTGKDAASIKANLERYGGLFLNTQSRFILGHTFKWDADMLHQRLDRYEMIVDSSDVSALLEHLLGRPIGNDRRKNVSPYHFDPAVFDADEMKDFLRRRNMLDDQLYDTLALRQKGEASCR
jgi:hypothetical protein